MKKIIEHVACLLRICSTAAGGSVPVTTDTLTAALSNTLPS